MRTYLLSSLPLSELSAFSPRPAADGKKGNAKSAGMQRSDQGNEVKPSGTAPVL
jgi:hypothetical protein